MYRIPTDLLRKQTSRKECRVLDRALYTKSTSRIQETHEKSLVSIPHKINEIIIMFLLYTSEW